MRNEIYKPPLRLVLTAKCNGKCKFCHQEGNTYFEDMPLKMIYECIDSAEELLIPKISLTGGEPTLRTDLIDIIEYIQKKQTLSVNLTTNGYHLKEITECLNKPIDNLNLSIFSLKEELAKEYQGVKPQMSINAMNDFKALKKTVNIVITKDNYGELDEFINLCRENDFLLDIMFEKSDDNEFRFIQRNILNNLVNSFEGQIILQSTPVLELKLNDKAFIRIKHPCLSEMLHNEICDHCPQHDVCFEKVCAVRVHPDGVVTPCLMREICFEGQTMYEKIEKAYKKINIMTLSNNFFDMNNCD